MLSEFIANKSDSQQVKPAVDATRDLMNQLLTHGSFGSEYCVIKLTNIQAGSRIVSRALGQSDTFKPCEGGIKARYNMITQKYNDNKLAKADYQELVQDVVTLEKIDTVSCDVATRAKALHDLQFIESLLPAIKAL